MSEKERVVQLLDDVPDYKVGYIVAFMQGLIADEDNDDAYCEKLYQDYLNDPDRGEFISFDEAVKMCGVDINAIRN